jgi:RNA recognition motif-containing protein
MNTIIYFDNLAVTVTESALTDLFSAYGDVINVSIAVDRTNPRPRSFGFVTMATPEGARAAIQALNGKAIGTETLAVSEAWPDEDRAIARSQQRIPRRQMSHLY